MPIIRSVKKAKKRNYLDLYLDDQIIKDIYIDHFLAQKLSPKGESRIEEQKLSDLIDLSRYQLGLEKSVNYISYRLRSKKEVMDYLRQKLNLASEVINKVTDKLESLSLLDDHKFAQAYIKDQLNLKGKSLKVVLLQLQRKGIKLSQSDLNLLDPQETELKNLKKLIEKKTRYLKGNLDGKKLLSLKRYLASKGYSFKLINEVLKSL